MPKPSGDVEQFALGLLQLRAATTSRDVSLAQQRCKELETLDIYREPLARAAADHRIGIVLKMRGCIDEAITRLLGARSIFDTEGRQLESALCVTEVAAILLTRGDVAGATSAYISVIDVIDREARVSQRAAVKANLASALQRSGNFIEAERLYLESLTVSPFLKPGPERATLLQNIAVIAKLDGRYDVAEERYREALRCIEDKGLYGQKARLKNGLADLALRCDDVELAKRLVEEIREIDEIHLSHVVRTEVASISARVAALDGDVQQAKNIVDKARTLSREAGLLDERHELLTDTLLYVREPSYRLSLLEELVEVQSERLKAVPSSVSSIIELRTRYEHEKAAREIERQQELTRVIMDTQTRMLEEIGRDLHDSVGQDLTVLQMMVERLAPYAGNEVDTQYEKTVETLKQVSERVYGSIRRLSHLLSGVGITGPGLQHALEDLGRDAMLANRSCHVETLVVGDLHTISDNVARTLLRLFQTLMQNILRHAKATKCTLQLIVRPDAIVASVEDNGIGYDLLSVERGLGTRELFARAELIGGSARIDSALGHGTFVEITVPMEARS
ncbi:MAG: tetratricopeptide repeat protein [Ignavibacteria bacterium]|nr:tetratricopeptide repeat protein [Ignavibacteria bacterium]MBK6420271.1 tetratricopeptide repeat protein [Ignavibacteria bacterium]MBK7412778.1 tetratricopeptide repeat protein [Ignavibacteria bacterium]